MSEVFLAERESDGQELALKLLDTRNSHHGSLLDRFIQECNCWSRSTTPT